MTAQDIAIEPLEWDSDFFGFPVARLTFHGKLTLDDAIAELRVSDATGLPRRGRRPYEAAREGGKAWRAFRRTASGVGYTPTRQIDAGRRRRTQPQS